MPTAAAARNERLYAEAVAAGDAAAAAEQERLVPSVLVQHAHPLDDTSPVVRRFVQPGGPSGFASVVVTPGNSSFARWLVKTGRGRKHYYGGVEFRAKPAVDGPLVQSLQLKEAWAYAASRVLNENGINAGTWSRHD